MSISLRQKITDFWNRHNFLLTAFIIPSLIMWMIYIAMEVYPFGSSSVLVLDLNGQYVYFFEELKKKVLEGSSLLYSWSRSMGGEFMGIFAYYIASPFSFLITLFSADHITEGLLVIILLKTGCMGASMAYYLNESRPTKKINILIFSTCYALSSYAVVMGHNTMWIDNLILLPLVTLGIERLIKRRQFKLFVVSLAMALLTNFYIGYMTCIYVAIYFFYYYIAHDNHFENNFFMEENHFWKSFVRIVIYSGIAICIAMIIIYPAYTSLQFGKSTFSTANFTFTQRFDLLDFFLKLFPGSYDTVRPEGLPWVYAGTLAVILLPLYFITSKIRWQERMMSAVILCILFLSFDVNAIDIVWHGFQKPNWLNYRYSFMFIFLVLVMAYKAYEHISSVNFKNVVIIGGGLILLLSFAQKLDYEWIGDFKTILFGVLCVGVFIVTLWIAKTGKYKQYATAVILLLVCVELFTSGLLNTMDLDEDVVISSRTSYNSYMEKVRPLVDYIKAKDDSLFYRMEKNFHKKTNDPMALDFYGISNSTSTLNKPVINMLHRYGYASKSHWTKYLGGTPAADSLLGIKYVISDGSVDNQVWKEIFYDEKHDYYIYENPYALSLAFASHSNVANLEITDYNSPFVLMNALTSTIVGSEEEIAIFKPLEVTGSNYVNIKTGFTSQHRKYSKKNTGADASVEYTVNVKAGVPVYMCIPTDYPRECGLYVNGEYVSTYFGNETDRIVYLGIYENDGEINVKLKLKDDPIYIMSGEDHFFYFDADLFKQVYREISLSNMKITHFEDDYIEGTVSSSEDQSLLYTSIVYDEGWIVTVDGVEQELVMTQDCLLAVNLDTPGEHHITFRYLPKCYTVGGAVSIIGVCAFVLAIVLDEIRKRREIKRWAIENNIF